MAPPGEPRPRPFYGPELARIHDEAFGGLARAGAETLVRRLRRAGRRRGLVVDLGCGSGIGARILADAGYAVLGVDLSEDLLAIARRRVPEARFLHASALDAPLPACVAVAAVGEVLSYAADPRLDRAALGTLFGRIRAALVPGGLLIADVAEPGREPRPRRAWHEGAGWVLCMDVAEDPPGERLVRRIITFAEGSRGWNRGEERHELRLHRRDDLAALLRAAGLVPRTLRGYGREVRFGRGHAGLLASRPPG